MPDPTPSLRVATEADIPALASLWTEAFPGSRSSEERERELHQGMALGEIEDCRLLEMDGRLAAALRAYRLEVHFRGRRYPTLGLAGVAVASDFRRRGLGRKICVDALCEAHRRGTALSLLFPFRASFYTSLGYVLAGELHQYCFRTAELPLFPGWERVERGGNSGIDEARGLYARVAPRTNGLLERKPSYWTSVITPGVDLYVYRHEEGPVTGYILVQRGRPGPRSRLRVKELLWEDEQAYLALLGWISAQRDQSEVVIYDALPSQAFYRHLPHPRREGSGRQRRLWFESARLLRGPMLRVLYIGEVLSSQQDEPLPVVDNDLTANTGVWRGRRREQSGIPAEDALSISQVSSRFLDGALPGQHPPPPGWAPISGIHDFHLLDEF